MSQPTPPSAPPRVFVSHSHQNNTYCRELVNGLRERGFAVWYDEHNLGWGALRQTIEREMPLCQHFVAIFSPAAVASEWVNAEIDAALELLREGILRTFTFVVAEPCVVPLLLRRWKRIEGLAGASVTVSEAIARLAHIFVPPVVIQQPAPDPKLDLPPAQTSAPTPPPDAPAPSPSTNTVITSSVTPPPAHTPSGNLAPEKPAKMVSAKEPHVQEHTPQEKNSIRPQRAALKPPIIPPQRRPNPNASFANMSPEARRDLAERIRKSTTPAHPPAEHISSINAPAPAPVHQKPVIPPASISLPPEVFPPRLATLGFTAHRGSDLTSVRVPIPNEDLKGQIIGREGRNLRAFETAAGVTLTIDDIPGAVTLSGSDPVSRTIAQVALGNLIATGRINPVSVEDAVARARREVTYTPGQRFDSDYILPPLCAVPAGLCQLGSDPMRDPDARPDEPLHSAGIPGFQIARYPVTVAEYACFVRAGHTQPRKGTFGVDWAVQLQRLDHPVTSVTWNDAAAYAAWLVCITGQMWRLATEDEWEKAARWDRRQSSGRIYPWGNTFNGCCNSLEGHNRATTPVGTYGASVASPCGAEDMAGNVWEWTLTAPTDSPKDRVLRGGSWDDLRQDARAACRNRNDPGSCYGTFGFRLILAAPGP